jgi:hypothetical protein
MPFPGWIQARRASAKLLPLFFIVSVVAFALTIFILLPLAVPKATRGFSSVSIFIASYVFGATLWMEGFPFTLSIWGTTAVIIGLLILGVGVVPIAMLATLVKGMWGSLFQLIALAIATFGSREVAFRLAATVGSDGSHA